jgi:hypothetical protein
MHAMPCHTVLHGRHACHPIQSRCLLEVHSTPQPNQVTYALACLECNSAFTLLNTAQDCAEAKLLPKILVLLLLLLLTECKPRATSSGSVH